jgi:hypothetical protein
MLNNLLRSCISRSTSENSVRNSYNKSLNDLCEKTVARPPFVVQKARHHVMASPLKYKVRNSAASLSVILTACTYAYIENIKFSVSAWLPLKVIGFSYLMVEGCGYITYYY